MLVSENGKELKIHSLCGGSDRYLNKPNLPIRKSLIGKVVLRKKTLIVLDVKKISGYRYPEIAQKEGLTSLAGIPIIYQFCKSLQLKRFFQNVSSSFSPQHLLPLGRFDFSTLLFHCCWNRTFYTSVHTERQRTTSSVTLYQNQGWLGVAEK